MADKINRELDGCYFRIFRDGKWQSICFSDLTKQEREDIIKDKDEKWLKSLCCHLADCLHNIGESLDIIGGG